MREIKFRSWHSGEKVMAPWHQMIDDHWDLSELNRRTVMQYTGLKDKNGKEIYEGDIFVSNFGTKFLVEWYQRDCRFAIVQVSRAHVPKFQGEYFTMFTEMSIETEVIGNIYENPELL